MFGHYTTGPEGTFDILSAVLGVRQPPLCCAQRLAQRFLTQRQRQIAARLLDDAACRVRGAPQTGRQRIGIVDRHQHRVDLVHRFEHAFASLLQRHGIVSLKKFLLPGSEQKRLRDFFEGDARFVALATLAELAQDGQLDRKIVAQAIKDLEINPEKLNPAKS